MSLDSLNNARQVAEHAADAAETVIAGYLRAGNWKIQYKVDDSPVTEADIETEKAIRAVLADEFSDAAFYGEETGRSSTLNVLLDEPLTPGEPSDTDALKNLWLVDPIDGTKSFIRNMPFFSTQIALQQNGELVVGVSNAPLYKERLVASAGYGAWLNNVQVHCRNITSLNEVFLSTGNLTRLAQQPAAWSALAEIITSVRRVRGYGDFCHYHQLCCGQTDLIIESDVNILDIAALTVGVREAGGVITDLCGRPVCLDTTSVLAASTPQLHASVLTHFSGKFTDDLVG